MKPNWQVRRSEFNHDWLKNMYIPKLGTWLNILDDEIEDDDFEKTFVDRIFPGFESQINEALSLPNDFINEMSPRLFINEPPLSNLDASTKDCLSELIHLLWLERYAVNNLVENACSAANEAIESYKRLQEALSSCNDTHDIEMLKPFRNLFLGLLSSCRALSKAVEKFPSEVRVV
ncbi:hypothetical protein HXX01_02540 [Candidatus Nomurabacteria bacterium]|nr:hypothetical protein [Candidatus Nomurabacteria bacterium]